MLSPEAIALLQSFGFDIGKGLITSTIVEWKKIKDDRVAQETADFFSDVDHSKAFIVRIQEKICQGFQQLLASHKYDQLIKELESDPDLLSELKTNPRFFEIRAEALFEEHEITEAFTVINQSIAQFQQSPALYTTRASFYQESGQLELAKEDFNNAVFYRRCGDQIKILPSL
jgi:hypothetical protein